jgi:hypothetical protein
MTMKGQLPEQEQRRQISLLPRLCQMRRGGELVWQATFEGSRRGERQSFARLDNLFSLLQDERRK